MEFHLERGTFSLPTADKMAWATMSSVLFGLRIGRAIGRSFVSGAVTERPSGLGLGRALFTARLVGDEEVEGNREKDGDLDLELEPEPTLVCGLSSTSGFGGCILR